MRGKQVWPQEFGDWKGRDLRSQACVFGGADGIYSNGRCEDARRYLPVLIGTLAAGYHGTRCLCVEKVQDSL